MKNTKFILSLFTSLFLCVAFAGAAGELFEASPAEICVSGALLFTVLFISGREMVRRTGYSFMEACGLATASILRDCDTPLTGGTKTTVWLGNISEVDDYTQDVYNKLIVSGITLASGKTLFKLEGDSGTNGSSVGANYKMVKLPFGRAWEHEVSGLAFSIDPDTKLELDKWVQGQLFMIVENKHKGEDGNSAFEIYGLDAGLQMEEFERNPNDKDTLGAFKFRLKTDENSREGNMPYTFWDTDYATTLAAINALL